MYYKCIYMYYKCIYMYYKYIYMYYKCIYTYYKYIYMYIYYIYYLDCSFCLGVNNYFSLLLYFCHFYKCGIKGKLGTLPTWWNLENFHSLVKYGKCTIKCLKIPSCILFCICRMQCWRCFLVIAICHMFVKGDWDSLNLPIHHIPYFFRNNPDIKQKCQDDCSCPYKVIILLCGKMYVLANDWQI